MIPGDARVAGLVSLDGLFVAIPPDTGVGWQQIGTDNAGESDLDRQVRSRFLDVALAAARSRDPTKGQGRSRSADRSSSIRPAKRLRMKCRQDLLAICTRHIIIAKRDR